MTVGIGGASSAIAQAFCNIVSTQACRPDEDFHIARPDGMMPDCERYLICNGYLAGKRIGDLNDRERDQTWDVNFVQIARMCDRILASNHRARICIIGSESGFAGSYDMAYAGAKAALHRYIETKVLEHPGQMLVGLAPHIVFDTRMTQDRPDLAAVIRRGKQTRLGRWLSAQEVAAEAYHLLYRASPSLSGQVIRMRAS